ncbi:hypothetical protein C8Q73DRAFT_243398 [Cubamyces lactineus]|nr:hypothetical protein C8Q73DRAFT_243398 [Cubamyces lactineus]
MKPPTPVARPEERAKAKSDSLGRLWTPNVMVTLAYPLRGALCGIATIEAAALLVQQLPPSISARLLSILPGLATSGLSMTPLFLVGSIMAIVGGTIRMVCHRALGRFFTWQMAIQDGHKLITTGPYSFVRHPSYSGWLLLVLGKALAVLGPGCYYVQSGLSQTRIGQAAAAAVFGYLAVVTYILCRRINKEDHDLSKEFGEEWRAWAKKTPYKLIPYVY